jgi:hypothetical protein
MDSMEFYHDLSDETRLLMNSLWEELKIESKIGASIYIICAVIVVALGAALITSFIKKKIRESYYD